MRPVKLLIGFALLTALSAYGQARNLPEDAERGTMRYLHDMAVEISGRPQYLAPGAQIRDASNRLIVPAAVPAGAPVKYLLDAAGMVRRVWILTPEEAARRLWGRSFSAPSGAR